MQPLFSVITVCLNHLDGLKNTAASLQAQTFKEVEWVIIDGGSDEHTLTFLKTTKADWTSEPDNGIYDAMNKGIERATGKYLLFLNAGDQLAASDTLKNIAATLGDDPTLHPDFIYGDAIEDGKIKQARPASTINQGLFTHHQAMLYAATMIKPMRYDLRYKIAADYDLTARVLQKNPATLYVSQPICVFETGGISQQNAALGRREQRLIRKNLKMTGNLKSRLISLRQILSWRLRTHTPKLYWFLRTKRFWIMR